MTRSARKSPQENLLKLLGALLDGEVHDRYTAAKKIGVNHAAAYDLLKLIVKYRPEIEEGSTRPVRFQRRAPVAEDPASIAAALAATLGAGFAQSFRNTLIEKELIAFRDRTLSRLSENKLRRFAHIDRKLVVLTPEQTDVGSREKKLLNVIDAVLDQREIKVEYHPFGKPKEHRVLQPLSLVALASKLYVLAPRDGQLRPFKFDRMRRATLTDKTFEYPSVASYDPALLFKHSMGIWVSDPEPVRIVIRLASPWGTYARHYKWHPSQSTKVLSDESVRLEFFLRPCPEFEMWVLGFAENAEVIEPESLRSKIAQRLRAATERAIGTVTDTALLAAKGGGKHAVGKRHTRSR